MVCREDDDENVVISDGANDEEDEKKSEEETEPTEPSQQDNDEELSQSTEDTVPTNKYELLDYCFAFLETSPDEMNSLLAGYFAKLVLSLLSYKKQET